MAETAAHFCAAVADYLSDELHIPIEYVSDGLWWERERLFDAGAIQILWLCGLPYVEKTGARPPDLELLAAPVPAGERYRGRPVCVSDIVVQNGSPYGSFFDLRGGRWAYNEQRSHSGYNVVRAYLAEFAHPRIFCGGDRKRHAHHVIGNGTARQGRWRRHR